MTESTLPQEFTQTLKDGEAFYFAGDRVSLVNIRHVAHVLSRTRRFSGLLSNPYWSAASHSVAITLACLSLNPEGREIAMDALMHDGHESYFGDTLRPHKEHFPGLHEAENEIRARFIQGFRDFTGITLSSTLPTVVKDLDEQALVAEMAIWGPRPHKDWTRKLQQPCWELMSAFKAVHNAELDEVGPGGANIEIPEDIHKELFLDLYKALIGAKQLQVVLSRFCIIHPDRYLPS